MPRDNSWWRGNSMRTTTRIRCCQATTPRSWPLFQLGYMTLLAWLGAFLVFQGGRLLGFH
jgi:hypothetical protein